MEKLFGRRNIQLQPVVDQDGMDILMAYTDITLQRNIMIEFYGVAVNDSDEIPEEIAIFALFHAGDQFYSYVLFVTDHLLGPLPVFRIIADAIDFIEHCDPKTLLADLEEIATSVTRYEKRSGYDSFAESAVWKFNTAMELIREKGK